MRRQISLVVVVAVVLILLASQANAFHRHYPKQFCGYGCAPCYTGCAPCYPGYVHWCPLKCLCAHWKYKCWHCAYTYPAWWDNTCGGGGCYGCGSGCYGGGCYGGGYGAGCYGCGYGCNDGAAGCYGACDGVVSDCALGGGCAGGGCTVGDVAYAGNGAGCSTCNGAPNWQPSDAVGPIQWSDRLNGPPAAGGVESVPAAPSESVVPESPTPAPPTPFEGASQSRARQTAFQLISQTRGEGAGAFEKGLIQMHDGSLNAALAEFERAAGAEPKNPLYQYHIALTLYSLSGADAGADALRTAVELEADAPIGDWGKRMERVQGRQRAWLEKARRDAGVVR